MQVIKQLECWGIETIAYYEKQNQVVVCTSHKIYVRTHYIIYILLNNK